MLNKNNNKKIRVSVKKKKKRCIGKEGKKTNVLVRSAPMVSKINTIYLKLSKVTVP